MPLRCPALICIVSQRLLLWTTFTYPTLECNAPIALEAMNFGDGAGCLQFQFDFWRSGDCCHEEVFSVPALCATGFLHIPIHAPHRFTSFWVIATWQHILLLVDSCLLCIPPPHSSNSSSGDRPHAASFLYIPTHALGHRYVAAHGAACRFLCHSTPWLNFDFLRSGNRPPATYLPKHSMATWQHVVLLVLFFASLQPHGSKLDFSTSGDHPHTARFLSLFDFSSPQLCCAAHIRFLNIPPPLSHCHCLPAYHFVCVASTAWFKLDFSSSSDYPHAPRHIHIPTPYTQSIAFILSLSYMRPVTPFCFLHVALWRGAYSIFKPPAIALTVPSSSLYRAFSFLYSLTHFNFAFVQNDYKAACNAVIITNNGHLDRCFGRVNAPFHCGKLQCNLRDFMLSVQN
ncbi:uncharacterized protein LACBIDRAFT_333770 [Laccaria bicolor S238N-H82]|uniref:Predicted protein n=1 Tax=Laccaria bicolor (strain S238N-H82 / ATCC MYA-4686) TaxID=486041 RepID=B0DX10_LACBS|nr:uncharacterized protein LACBIDRAFT_333770 [Laccaria bicolor S238N-H82]EDR00852.1 predicted protein [Laccaria bicolor S238N-H82]|eukprot:XP_001888446.1 predicted protein [Laccaria bicolor S238N-H82]